MTIDSTFAAQKLFSGHCGITTMQSCSASFKYFEKPCTSTSLNSSPPLPLSPEFFYYNEPLRNAKGPTKYTFMQIGIFKRMCVIVIVYEDEFKYSSIKVIRLVFIYLIPKSLYIFSITTLCSMASSSNISPPPFDHNFENSVM